MNLEQLTCNLDFDFKQSFIKYSPSTIHEAGDARIGFHRLMESACNQSLYIIHTLHSLFKSMPSSNQPNTPKIAFLLSDLFPESSEALLSLILEKIFKIDTFNDWKHSIVLLSRRGQKLQPHLPKAFSDLKMEWDWSSQNVKSLLLFFKHE